MTFQTQMRRKSCLAVLTRSLRSIFLLLAAEGRNEKWPPRCIAKPGVTKVINRRAALRHQPDEAAGIFSALEPLIALPSTPGKVVPVREVEGQDIYQSYIGSSANPGYRDIAVVAEIVAGRRAR